MLKNNIELRLCHNRSANLKVDSRFRGHDRKGHVIPAKAGIQHKSGGKIFSKTKISDYDTVSIGDSEMKRLRTKE